MLFDSRIIVGTFTKKQTLTTSSMNNKCPNWNKPTTYFVSKSCFFRYYYAQYFFIYVFQDIIRNPTFFPEPDKE